MKITDPKHPWQRLVAGARMSPADSDVAAPYGFATRVAASGLAQPRWIPSLFESFAPRAIWVAALLVLGSVALNYSELGAFQGDQDSAAPGEDPVELLFADGA